MLTLSIFDRLLDGIYEKSPLTNWLQYDRVSIKWKYRRQQLLEFLKLDTRVKCFSLIKAFKVSLLIVPTIPWPFRRAENNKSREKAIIGLKIETFIYFVF